MKECGKSILVTMQEELSSTNALKSLLKNQLVEYNDFEYTIVDKKKAVIDCKEDEEAIKAETKLKIEVQDAWVSRN